MSGFLLLFDGWAYFCSPDIVDSWWDINWSPKSNKKCQKEAKFLELYWKFKQGKQFCQSGQGKLHEQKLSCLWNSCYRSLSYGFTALLGFLIWFNHAPVQDGCFLKYILKQCHPLLVWERHDFEAWFPVKGGNEDQKGPGLRLGWPNTQICCK